MIKINHLTITQNKDLRDLISDLNMTIQDGEKVAIIGEEGNGKSTLLRTLMGERLADFTIRGEIQSDLQSLAYIPQHLPEELKKKSLQDYFFLESTDLDYSILYRLSDELHFDSSRFASDQEIGSLSGGEALKIQLIHELAKPFEILFLDEPSNDLDIEMVDWLKKQKKKCAFMDDLTILSSWLEKDDIYLNEDKYVEWWDAVYHHTWQNPDLKTDIIFFAPKDATTTNTVIIIDYSSQKYQDFEKKSKEENRDSTKNNL